MRDCKGAIRRGLAVEKIFCNSQFPGGGGMCATHQGHMRKLQRQKGDGVRGECGQESLLWLPQEGMDKKR